MAITVKRPEGVVEFCTDMALRADWEAATSTLEQARKNDTDNGDRRMSDVDPVTELAHEVQQIEATMREASLKFVLQALSRRRWQELGEEHPPRDENRQDAAMGVNVSTFFDAVAAESITSVTHLGSGKPVEFDPKTEWIALADEMTDGQYKVFCDEMLRINRAVTQVPFSSAASRMMRRSGPSSN